jgi:hypothetical protein
MTAPEKKSAYVEAERLLRELHVLIGRGEGSTDRADELREDGALVWKDLTAIERENLQRLSVSLAEASKSNTLHESSSTKKPARNF